MADNEEAIARAEELIPVEVRMISGCRDEQTSADVSNVSEFKLPDPAGRAGGACTSALLKVVYADHENTGRDLSFQEVLLSMREILSEGQYTQIPQLTASRPLDIHTKFDLVPPEATGRRIALLIGINYVGQDGELSGCQADCMNMLKYIKDIHGFEDENITLLLDDGEHTPPTRDNILNAYATLAREAQPGDAVFCHYSGHGGKVRDDDGDEADGYDETLVPVDYASAGQIRDDDVFKTLVGPMSRGVVMTCVYDCCHSGTILDLPFQFKADGEQEDMTVPEDFDFEKLAGLFSMFMAAQQGGVSAGEAVEIVQVLCDLCTVL